MTLKYLVLSAFVWNLSFYVYASDDPSLDPSLSSSSSSSSLKRPRSQEIDDFRPFKRQKYADPTYDSVFKHIVKNSQVRTDLVRSLSGIANIENVELLSEHLEALNGFSEIRRIFADKTNRAFLEGIASGDAKIRVLQTKNGDEDETLVGNKFIQDISKHYDDITTLLSRKRNSQLDFLGETPEGYVLIEVQVNQQKEWDKRALHYLASVYSHQNPGAKWDKLKSVIAINILGDGTANKAFWKASTTGESVFPARHYLMQDQYNNKNIIPEMQLVQYSLGNFDPEDSEIKDKNIFGWLDYFKNAHKKDELPEGINDSLKTAYELIEFTELPGDISALYDQEQDLRIKTAVDEDYAREQGIEKGIEKGLNQVALTMIKAGNIFTNEMIVQATGLTLEDVQALRKEREDS